MTNYLSLLHFFSSLFFCVYVSLNFKTQALFVHLDPHRPETLLLCILRRNGYKFTNLPIFLSLFFFPPGRPTTLCELMGKADIWLIRNYWDFEFPHPFLPNFEFVGGLHCKPAKPLPKVTGSCLLCFILYFQ